MLTYFSSQTRVGRDKHYFKWKTKNEHNNSNLLKIHKSKGFLNYYKITKRGNIRTLQKRQFNSHRN